tara:strand:+ start:2020 stop:2298 length:279 start_codon:yes stop_codon:yes gene_type:complete
MATLRQRNNSMLYGIERKKEIYMADKIDPRVSNIIKTYDKQIDDIQKDIESTLDDIKENCIMKDDIDKGWIEALEYVLVLITRKVNKEKEIV